MFLAKNSGFTLLEILLAITLICILMSIAVPNFGLWTANYRLKAATRSVCGFLYNSRSLSAKKSQKCKIFVSSYTCCLEKYDETAKEWLPGSCLNLEGITASASSKPVFYPSGTVSPTTTITLKGKKGLENKITVSISGRIRVK